MRKPLLLDTQRSELDSIIEESSFAINDFEWKTTKGLKVPDQQAERLTFRNTEFFFQFELLRQGFYIYRSPGDSYGTESHYAKIWDITKKEFKKWLTSIKRENEQKKPASRVEASSFDNINIWSKGEVSSYINYLAKSEQILPCVNLVIRKGYLDAFYPECISEWASSKQANNVATSPTAYNAPSSYSWPVCPKDCSQFEATGDFIEHIAKPNVEASKANLVNKTRGKKRKIPQVKSFNLKTKNLPVGLGIVGILITIMFGVLALNRQFVVVKNISPASSFISLETKDGSTQFFKASSEFPLEVGNRWRYEGTIEQELEGKRIVRRYVQIMMSVRDCINYGDISLYVMNGDPMDAQDWDGKRDNSNKKILRPQASKYGYLEISNKLYYVPSEALGKLERKMKEKSFISSDDLASCELRFEFPLFKKQRFGEIAQSVRPDLRYFWYVDDEFLFHEPRGDTVGEIKEFKVVQNRLPDYTEIRFLPHLGITYYKYSHHGTKCEVRLTLKDSKIKKI